MAGNHSAVKVHIDHVVKKFNGRNGEMVALNGVDMDIHENEFICVVGPSGCGKSTLLNIIGGLETPTEGKVLVDGAEVTGPGPDRGIVFQQYALFPWLTVEKNVQFGLKLQGKSKEDEAHWHIGLYQKLMSNSSVSRIILACAAFLSICAYGKKTPHRSFMHSFLAGGLLSSSVAVFLPMLVPYFGAAFLSHLALDLLNHKGEQLFYPHRKRFSLGICTASGLINKVFLLCGSVVSA